jgi:NAD(P)-dependent dehydrogenase (short-subunit alcohol dehydrogenase family)
LPPLANETTTHISSRTGFGRDLTLAALKRGDNVIATARSLSKIQDLREAGADILELDVTSPLDQLHATVKQAVDVHGRIDVVVNNAAYIAVGALEETTWVPERPRSPSYTC